MPVRPCVFRTATVSSLIGVPRSMAKSRFTRSGLPGSSRISRTLPTSTPLFLNGAARGEPEHAGDQHGAEDEHERADDRIVHFGFDDSLAIFPLVCTSA